MSKHTHTHKLRCKNLELDVKDVTGSWKKNSDYTYPLQKNSQDHCKKVHHFQNAFKGYVYYILRWSQSVVSDIFFGVKVRTLKLMGGRRFLAAKSQLFEYCTVEQSLIEKHQSF